MRSTAAIVSALLVALSGVVACADDATEQSTLADQDHVIDQFIVILQRPESPHQIDRSTAAAELVSPEAARAKLLEAGGGTISELEADAWSEDIWLVKIRGVFDGVPGMVFGVVDPDSGLAAKSAVVPD